MQWRSFIVIVSIFDDGSDLRRYLKHPCKLIKTLVSCPRADDIQCYLNNANYVHVVCDNANL